MNCPNCNTLISKNTLVCPKCKKVLKLQCPTCNNITKKSICEKCGTIILNKCYKCGKLNSTSQSTCPKCGLDINASIGLRESLIEEFAVLTVEITNFEDFRTAFQSNKLTEQFKENLYSLIKKTGLQKRLRVQFIENTFIIRFCKDLSFLESCLNAVDFAIYIAQTVTEINKKLFEAKGITLRTQMAIQKRDVYSKPNEYKSGININVVYSASGASHLFNNIEVVVDSFVYQETKEKFPYQSLSAVQIKNQMVMFFELILHKLIELNEEKKLQNTTISLPKNLDYEPEEEIEDTNLINFKSLNCSFVRAKGEQLKQRLLEFAQKEITNPIISIKTTQRNNVIPLLSSRELREIFADYNIVKFDCPKKNKFSPYGLLKQIYLKHNDTSELEIINDTILRESIAKNTDISNLLRMIPPREVHPEDIKFAYYEAFTNFIQSIEEKTIFVIQDFENADETSIEILKYLLEKKQLGNIGFIVTNSTDFSLHRKIYKLMTSNNYLEIEMKPSSNKTIVNENVSKLNKIKNSFFMEKVLENTKGSRFYYQQALEYLVDNNILEFKNEKYEIVKNQMIVIPNELDELVQKRITNLKTISGAFELYGSLILLAETCPIGIYNELNIENKTKALIDLQEKNLIDIIDDKKIIIKNYNFYRKNFIASCTEDELAKISQNLIEKIYMNTDILSINKAEIFEFAKLKKEAFNQWHNLAIISSQLGDFCAYLNNTNKFLSLVDNVIDEETDKNVEQIKLDVYTELATMLYKYYPDKTMNFLEVILNNLEHQNDNEKVKEIANKLVQSCLISGNYNNALAYIGKIIARTPKGSFNPNDKSFNLNYFLMNLVTLEIYFNLGKLKECIDLGEEVLKYVNFENANDETFLEGKLSKKEYIEALIDAHFFVNTARLIQLKPDRKEKLEALVNQNNQTFTCFELLLLLNEIYEGKDITEKLSLIAQKGINDKYSELLFPIIQGILCLMYQKWDTMGNYIYNAKIKAFSMQQHQINYFCDLMIGYAYMQLNNNKKAKEIFYSVLDTANEKGLKNINALSWYFIAKAENIDNKKGIALDILNKALIKMEKDANCSEFFLLSHKMLLAQILLEENTQSNIEQALFCAEQAYNIILKDKIYTSLPQISDMLIFIYTVIANSSNSEFCKNEQMTKIEKIKQTMTGIFQQ